MSKLISHKREIEVFLFPHLIRYDIPIHFEEEKALMGQNKYWMRIEVDKFKPLFIKQENPVVVQYKNPPLE